MNATPPIGDDVISRTALATLRRHAASPLTGTPPFWERLVRTVLDAYVAQGINGIPGPEQVDAVARAAAPEFASSPITNSDMLFLGIVTTVLTEYLSPSGMGEPIPRRSRAPSPIEPDDQEPTDEPDAAGP